MITLVFTSQQVIILYSSNLILKQILDSKRKQLQNEISYQL